MKIILFPSSFYPVNGGLQEAVYRLSKEFKIKGKEVLVITQRYPRNLRSNEEFDGTSVYRQFFPNVFPIVINWVSFFKYMVGLLIAAISLLRLICILKSFKPDVLYLHFVGCSSIYVLAALFCIYIKLIVTFHGEDVEGLPNISRYHRWLFKKVCERADYATACSEYLLERAKSLCPAIRSKSSPIYNGISLNEFKNVEPYKHNRQYFFAAGRFVHKKGFDVLIRAYKNVLEKRRNIDLILAGEGDERQNYEKLADEIGLRWRDKNTEKNNISSRPGLIFWGWSKRSEIKSLIAGSKAFIVPSRKEPFGLVVLEGMSLGVPVIASAVGGIPEIAKNDSAVLIEPDNEVAIADAVEKVLNDSELRKRLYRNGKAAASGFTWEKIADQYLSLAIDSVR